ncbi:acyl-CoA dehydrogenase family protein [Silicimonas algicola]|uniref:Alkylation response protein AidB-like acyl-CoA dehydrogenase n=1 Tax=Silicimonas algicola TaxID=1826607 RepID=A0A316GV36_9RHOB|nr:acyl-CoA dehydrogenase family protein [Silicimonas algicola]PWK58917.1 alkylation response protein AidB-like acyl-CoA dehydrogenase [Silicimonas algicola]
MTEAETIAERVESFVRGIVVPFERDPRRDHHGAPAPELTEDLRALAREHGVMTPHIRADGSHLSHRDTATVLIASGLSPLGPLAVNTASPDEGNMFLLGAIGSADIKARFLAPMLEGRVRSAFFMTEPSAEGGAGSDPSMMKTTCRKDGNHWVIEGRKRWITQAAQAGIGIVMAKADEGACMFVIDLPDPAVRIESVPNTIDNSLPGGHCTVALDGLRVPADQMLGAPGEGFRYAQVRLAPARLTHCMRWLGACLRAQEIATDYVCRREAFGKRLIDHEGVGFMLADNMIDLRQCGLMIDWCADALDRGDAAIVESSMTKVAVSEALMRVADRCVQVMGATGVSDETVVEQIFREVRAFRIYDGPSEVHRWSLAKKIRRDWDKANA